MKKILCAAALFFVGGGSSFGFFNPDFFPFYDIFGAVDFCDSVIGDPTERTGEVVGEQPGDTFDALTMSGEVFDERSGVTHTFEFTLNADGTGTAVANGEEIAGPSKKGRSARRSAKTSVKYSYKFDLTWVQTDAFSYALTARGRATFKGNAIKKGKKRQTVPLSGTGVLSTTFDINDQDAPYEILIDGTFKFRRPPSGIKGRQRVSITGTP